MRIKLFACEVFFREICHYASSSKNVLDMEFIPFGLHNTPKQLRQTLQERIDSVAAESCDYVAVAYGLCSGGTSALSARSIPLVLPRAHDCITLFLGSRQRYDKEFAENPGTYYYTAGWIERADGENDQGRIVELKERERALRFEEYKQKYGEDNAAFLIEQESQWLANYNRAALINTSFGDVEAYRRFAQEVAESKGWEYQEIPGDTNLLRNLINGSWDPAEFLVVPPGAVISQSLDDMVVHCEQPDERQKNSLS